jgi:hypothetical protein
MHSDTNLLGTSRGEGLTHEVIVVEVGEYSHGLHKEWVWHCSSQGGT